MFHVSSASGRRVRWRIAAVVVTATAFVAFAFTNFSTAQDRPAFSGPPSFADVVEYVSPAVVNISVTKTVRSMPTSGLRRLPPGQSPLDEFLNQFFGMPGVPEFREMPREREALGSGFIIDAEGYIATNRHVVEGADKVFVTFPSGDKVEATIIGQDQQTDLALLKIDAPDGIPSLRFGNSDQARVGDWVIAIGNPFGLGGTATAGIISARGRDIQAGIYDDYLQIDAPINQGNSGGPVFNAAGEVIGINTAIFTPNGGNIGIGFAIPANQAKAVIAELKDSGSVSRGWLGVQIQDLDEGLAESLGYEGTNGALVTDIVDDSPAERAGLMPGDIVTEFDGKPVDSTKALGRLVADEDTGSHVSLTVWRDGRARDIDVELGELENDDQVARLSPAGSDVGSDLGLTLQDLSQADREQLGIDEGVNGAVVARVAPGSTAAREGIEPGDVILEVNQQDVESASDVLDELAAARTEGRRALLLVRRGDAQRFVVLDFA